MGIARVPGTAEGPGGGGRRLSDGDDASRGCGGKRRSGTAAVRGGGQQGKDGDTGSDARGHAHGDKDLRRQEQFGVSRTTQAMGGAAQDIDRETGQSVLLQYVPQNSQD